MTTLHKPVRRVSQDSIVRDAGRYRSLAVTLYPGGTIGLRPSGTRREDFVSLEMVYQFAIKQRVRTEQKEKKAVKKVRKHD